MRKSDYYEIQVSVNGHRPMRELVLATCKAEALDKAKAKYRYVKADIALVPMRSSKLKLTRSSDNPKRRRHNSQTA